ncbi:hypothetical protein AB6D20_027525 (plasmid) [Vibrio splendidus]
MMYCDVLRLHGALHGAKPAIDKPAIDLLMELTYGATLATLAKRVERLLKGLKDYIQVGDVLFKLAMCCPFQPVPSDLIPI